ncbi:MAG TPA: alpha/beta fold hydrolase [Thermoleophilaceae bacterium]|jgi:haloalkane dehalogenase
MTTIALHTVEAGGLRLAYRELGEGPPVLLLHGWPTSSHLWRDVMPAVAEAGCRAIALDLPGFGGSSKPPGATYSFELYDGALDGFLEAVGVEATALAVHDIGGPIGLHWAVHRPERLTKLVLLNTLVYPEFDEMAVKFVETLSTPGPREQLVSPAGLEFSMRFGLADESNLTPETLAAVVEPFGTDAERQSLADAGIGLDPAGFEEIARLLPQALAGIPVRIVYGEQDRILPTVAETMARVKRDLPQAEVSTLPEAGHFLQEEAGPEIGRLLAAFLAT